jgi:hypothetical protein
MYVRTYVCMYVCMYVCTYVMYVCMYVCTYVIYVCMYVCRYVCTYVCMNVRTYVCMYVRMYVCMYVCTYVIMYARIVYVCNYVRTYLRMYVCMHVFGWSKAERWHWWGTWHVARIWEKLNVCRILVGKPELGRRHWDRTPIPPSIARPPPSRHVLCEMSGRAAPNIIEANFRPLYSPIRNLTAWRAYAAGCRAVTCSDVPRYKCTLRTAENLMAGTCVLRWLRNINSSFMYRYVTVCFDRKLHCVTRLRKKLWAFGIYLFLTFAIYLPPSTLTEHERVWWWIVLVYLENSTGQNEGKSSKTFVHIWCWLRKWKPWRTYYI